MAKGMLLVGVNIFFIIYDEIATVFKMQWKVLCTFQSPNLYSGGDPESMVRSCTRTSFYGGK